MRQRTAAGQANAADRRTAVPAAAPGRDRSEGRADDRDYHANGDADTYADPDAIGYTVAASD